ncbi:hypothetical protein L7F22_020170 [Adiantum nelumboides]|nr:hypothetical protein [Adiantum nelumboides]
MWQMVGRRETGGLAPHRFRALLQRQRLHSIELASHKEVVSVHKSGINSLQVSNESGAMLIFCRGGLLRAPSPRAFNGHFGSAAIFYGSPLPEAQLKAKLLAFLSFNEGVIEGDYNVFKRGIDVTDARYLLSGAADGSVAVYDIEHASSFEQSTQTSKHEALFMVGKGVGHQYSVSCVHWYPIDTGLFVTGSFDNYVNVWDTNTAQVEVQFNMSRKVYAVSMSNLSTTHMLIATGTEDTKIRLCDIASGAFTHTLTGHRDSVWVVQWSTKSEWVLVSGGCDGAIRFWDIRRAGCYQVLDQQCSQIGRRPPVLKGISRVIGRVDTTASSSSSKSSSTKQRGQKRHFGVSASDSRTAHYGSVTGLQMTSDGLYLISAGTDSRLRLWDVESGCNTLVNYPSVHVRGHKGMQMALSPDSTLLFLPSRNAIMVCDVWSGHAYSPLRGHYDLTNCCTFHPQGQELYSGSNDRKILVWAPPGPVDTTRDLEAEACEQVVRADEDAWSD